MNDDFFDPIDDDGLSRPTPFSLEDTLAALSDENHAVLPAGAVYGLSDMIAGADLEAFRSTWSELSVERRRTLIDQLAEISEMNFELDYEPIALVLFDDDDDEVRSTAVDLPWYSTSMNIYNAMVRMADDPSPLVRARVMSAMGRFIYLGELEEFDLQLAEALQRITVDHYDNWDEDLEVRRRALEAISHCSHPRVPEMIEESYQSDEILMQVSSVFAMGASCDDRWADTVLRELDNYVDEMRFEAARAAGQLSLSEAVPRLTELAYETDVEVQLASVWALGEIGTREAQRSLEAIANWAEENEDDDLVEATEEALEVASLVGGFILPMFDFSDDDDFYTDDDEYYDDEFDDDPSSFN
ncbi:MAG: HEAT repeat domain-containing protein [Anaerolineales bacterium]|nr:HEAT repeat domain-containing protein [Anaerolineales bacterium]